MKKIKCDEIWDYIPNAKLLYRHLKGHDIVMLMNNVEHDVYPFIIDWGEREGNIEDMNITRPHDPADDIGKFGLFYNYCGVTYYGNSRKERWGYVYDVFNTKIVGTKLAYIDEEGDRWMEFKPCMPEPTKTWEKK